MYQGVSSSRRFFPAIFLLAVGALGAVTAVADPVVTNVRASQRADGSGLVDVFYDVAGGASTMVVNLYFSSNDGAQWDIVPLRTLLYGDIGPGVTNGVNRHIVWDAGRDRPGVQWPQARARVTAAETGQTMTIMLPGEVPLEMVLVPAGVFLMGSPYDEQYLAPSEAPQRTVTIGQPFYLGKFEVTQAQWWAIMGTKPSYFTGANRPVEEVSWNDSQAFITALNALGKGVFRLPTEAEWEYACRAGTSTRWFFGDSPDRLGDYAWYASNSNADGTGQKTQIVGLKLPNPFGLYDMTGNVWEWCQDWYHSTYQGAPTDGSAWEDPVGTYRVLRGGAWYDDSSYCRSAFRSYSTPDGRLNSCGLRLVRTF